MIFSENRYPLFGIMLREAASAALIGSDKDAHPRCGLRPVPPPRLHPRQHGRDCGSDRRSKDELLAAVLETQHRLALAAFRTFGDSLGGSPETIVDTLFRDLAAWSDKPRWAGSGFTRLVVELADLPGHPARVIARRHKAMLEAHLAELLARANVRSPREIAREIWLLSEGAISLMLVHRDRSYAAAAALAAKKLLRLNSAKRK